MKHRCTVIKILTIICISSFFIGSVNALEVVTHHNMYDFDGESGSTYDDYQVGQTFRPVNGSQNITSVSFHIKRDGNLGDQDRNVRIELRATDGDPPIPNGAPLLTVWKNCSTVSDSYFNWIKFNFTSPYLMTNNTFYAVTLTIPNGTASNRVICHRTESAAPGNYTDGALVTINGSQVWESSGGMDLLFKIWNDVQNATVTATSPSAITASSVSLHGNLTHDGNMSCTAKFYYDTSSKVQLADYANEVYVGSRYVTGDNFTQILTGLSSAQIYYYRSSADNTGYTGNSSEVMFLTTAEAPTSFSTVVDDPTTINVSWVKGTGANHTYVMRKTTAYPASINDGTNIYNGTGTYHVDSGLSEGITYYYRAWSYNEWHTLHQYSANYSSNDSRTEYSYTIQVVYENDFSTYVDMGNGTYIFSIYGEDFVSHNTVTSNNATFNYTTSSRPRSLRLTVNDTYYRARIPTNNSGTYRFVIPHSGETADTYFFTLDDRSGIYAPPDVYLQLYTYNESTQYIVHEEWFSQDRIAQAYLLQSSPYNRYWAYLYNMETSDSYGAIIVTANATLEQSLIVYPSGIDTQYLFNEVITFTVEASQGQYPDQSPYYNLHVNYTDALEGTTWANITVYELADNEQTIITGGTYNSEDYTFTQTFTILKNRTHYVELLLIHDDIGYHRAQVYWYHTPTAITTDTTLEDYFVSVLGENPLGWVNMISYVFAIVVLMLFAPINAGLAVTSSGLMLGFMQIFLGISAVNITVCILLVVGGVIWMMNKNIGATT